MSSAKKVRDTKQDFESYSVGYKVKGKESIVWIWTNSADVTESQKQADDYMAKHETKKFNYYGHSINKPNTK